MSSNHAAQACHRYRSEMLVEWLASLKGDSQNWTIFLTITMKRSDQLSNQNWNFFILDRAVTKFIDRLNVEIFNHAYRRKQRSLGVICVRHLGSFGSNPHYHFVISSPEWLDLRDLISRIRELASRINWFDEQIDIQAYESTGAIGYLTTDSYWELITSATNAAK